MKIKTIFIACDDKEFDSMEECSYYENTLYDYFFSIALDCEFINSKGQQITFAIDENNWESTCENFSHMYNLAKRVIVKENLSQNLIYFINITFGYELPQNKGTYIFKENAKCLWEKVD